MVFKLLINIVMFVIFVFIIIRIVKSHSTITLKLFKIVFFIIIIWLIMFSTDYILTQKQKTPLFCTKFGDIFMLMDGGTVEYWGFGYKIFDFHKIVAGDPKWSNIGIFSLNYKYICPWSTSYNQAFTKVEEKFFNNQ